MPRSAPAAEFSQILLSVLQNKDIPADKLAIVLQTQRQIMEEQRIESFNNAFVEMSAVMPQVRRDGTVELVKDGKKLGSYKFARWEDMDKVIRPILYKFGFGLTFAEHDDPNGVVVEGSLLHVDGHFRTARTRMPPDVGPGRNQLQARGSSVSYAKRYLAEELCNIVRCGVDDDGISAGLQPISLEQKQELALLLKDVKTSPETFLRLFVTGIENMHEIPAREFPRLKNALLEKKQSMGKGSK